MREYRSLELWIQREAAYEPREEAVQAWINAAREPERKRSSLKKFIASLIEDTFDEPMLAGVRAVAFPPRQLLFRAAQIDVDVDVTIESMDGGERLSLVGQVLSTAQDFVDNAAVVLKSRAGSYTTQTNEVGEFLFEVPKDTYNISIDLPAGQLVIFSVPPRDPQN